MAVTLKLVLVPVIGEQVTTLVGFTVILGAVLMVRVAAELVAAGEQVPLTTHSYIYPLTALVAPVRFKVAEVTFV